jgi:acyl carrier protein
VISTTDLQERLEKWVNLTSIQKSANTAADAGLHSRPSLSTEYAAPRTEVEKTVADVWQEILGVAPIGVHDKFFELGGHSLLAVQLIAQLREAFQVELSAQRLFEAPTVAQLAGTIELELKKVQAEEEQREQEQLEELLDLVENLTDEQVSEMLARESTSTGGQAHGASV